MTNKDLDYYLNLDWTLIEGTEIRIIILKLKKSPALLFVQKQEKKRWKTIKNNFDFHLC